MMCCTITCIIFSEFGKSPFSSNTVLYFCDFKKCSEEHGLFLSCEESVCGGWHCFQVNLSKERGKSSLKILKVLTPKISWGFFLLITLSPLQLHLSGSGLSFHAVWLQHFVHLSQWFGARHECLLSLLYHLSLNYRSVINKLHTWMCLTITSNICNA